MDQTNQSTTTDLSLSTTALAEQQAQIIEITDQVDDFPEALPCYTMSARNIRTIERAVKRAAMRDLRERKRAVYAAENAEERAALERLRHERLAAEDALKAQEWRMNVERELAAVERHAEWLDAHNTTIDTKRVTRAAQKAARAENAPVEKQLRKELRAQLMADDDAQKAELRALNTTRELTAATYRADWLDAHQRTADAKQGVREAVRELRRAKAAERPARKAAKAAERLEREAAEEARAHAVRQATKERAVAEAMLREAAQGGSREEIEAARIRLGELRLAEADVKMRTRAERQAAEDARKAAQWKADSDASIADAQRRDAWIQARYEEKQELKRAREAEKTFRKQVREQEKAAAKAARSERNARHDAYNARLRELDTTREMRLASLQEEYLVARETETALRKKNKADDRALVPVNRAAEREASIRRREERNALRDEHTRIAWEMAKNRELSRGQDRENALAAASITCQGALSLGPAAQQGKVAE